LLRLNDDFPILVRGGNGVPYQFSAKKVSAWWRDHQDQTKSKNNQRQKELKRLRLTLFGGQMADDTRIGFTAAEIAKEIEAEVNALKLAKARGEYVLKADVERCAVLAFTQLRKDMTQLGTEITRALGLEVGARTAIDKMVESKLERCSDRLSRQENYAQVA